MKEKMSTETMFSRPIDGDITQDKSMVWGVNAHLAEGWRD